MDRTDDDVRRYWCGVLEGWHMRSGNPWAPHGGYVAARPASDADLAEAVREWLNEWPPEREKHSAYRSVDWAIEWYDNGPLAFLRAVLEVVDD